MTVFYCVIYFKLNLQWRNRPYFIVLLFQAKPSVEEPSVSASFKEKADDANDEEKDKMIEKLKGIFIIVSCFFYTVKLICRH